jgi:hypothetical protein
MANRWKTKGQTIIYKTLLRKLKIEQHEPNFKPGWTYVLRKGKQFLLHKWHPLSDSCWKHGDMSWMKKEPDCD